MIRRPNRQHIRPRALFFVCAVIVLLSVFLPPVPAQSGVKVTDVAISADPTKLPCPGQTEVKVTVSYEIVNRNQGISTPLGNIVAMPVFLMDDDNWFTGFNDCLDIGGMLVNVSSDPSPGTKELTFSVWCDSCCEGGVTGNLENSGENSAEIFAGVLQNGTCSPTIDIECDHDYTAETSVSINDGIYNSDDMIVALLELTDDVTDIQQVFFSIEFDPYVLELDEIVQNDPVYEIEGGEWYINVTVDSPTGIDLSAGVIAELRFTSPDSAAYDKTILDIDPPWYFINTQGDTLEVRYDNGAITLLPPDLEPPLINDELITVMPDLIIGGPGTVTDNLQDLPEYLSIGYYDPEYTIWHRVVVNEDGGFEIIEPWVNPGTEIELIAWDKNGGSDTCSIQTQSHFPDVTTTANASGRAGTQVPVTFYVKNWSGEGHTYDLEFADSLGWTISGTIPEIHMSSFAETEVMVNVTIPFRAIGSNTVTMTARSQENPGIEDSASLIVEVLPVSVVDPEPVEVFEIFK